MCALHFTKKTLMTYVLEKQFMVKKKDRIAAVFNIFKKNYFILFGG